MGSFFGDIIDTFTGGGAASDAAGIQAGAANQAIDVLRGDLAPVRDTLGTSIPMLLDLISNQGDQSSFVADNPLLNNLFDDVTKRILSNQAAGGRVGAGDTRTQLLSSIIPIGLDFFNQSRDRRFNELFNTASLGANAAGQSGAGTAELLTQRGNALAAGEVGRANARSGLFQQFLGSGAGALAGSAGLLGPGVSAGGGAALGLLSDVTMKENITKVNEINGIGLYEFNYIDDDDKYISVMAQEVRDLHPHAVIEHDGLLYIDKEELSKIFQGQEYAYKS